VGGSAAFVGRERELSRLRTIVGGEARLLLVIGDAGVGKTRFVTEGMRRAAAHGVVSVWGECLPMRETLPLLPVADALDELSRVDRGELLEAALAVTPRYVRAEVERLLPELGSGAAKSSGPGDSGQRERLFAAVAELLGAAAQRRRIVLVVEDAHWADTATLDCLTFLTRARRNPAVTVVVTCRSDEAPLQPQVTEWLTHVRGRGGVAEVRLGPLTRDEVAEQIVELAGSPAPMLVVDELYARAEGNPFFTEQLAAAVVGSPGGVLRPGAALPARLAELLVARAARCTGPARTVLSALAVAGRPLGEDLLPAVSGLDVDDVRSGLRELTAARLLADSGTRGEQRPRHALLAEAVAAELLPSEQAAFHEHAARALQALGDDTSAAEAAGHWAAAGRAAEELPARVRAAEAAEHVFGYAQAARHWQRAIDLFEQVPDPEQVVGMDLPHLYLRGPRHALGGRRPSRWRRARRGGISSLRRPSGPGRRSGPSSAHGHVPMGQVAGRCASAVRAGAAPVRAGATIGRPRQGLAPLRRISLYRRGPEGRPAGGPRPRAGGRRGGRRDRRRRQHPDQPCARRVAARAGR
jgi:predicted ATPase